VSWSCSNTNLFLSLSLHPLDYDQKTATIRTRQ
jgi:hypothetical protein